MAAELEADLTAAENDGTSVGAYVGGDLRGFALEWASARGLVRTRLALGSTALASILGTIPGAFFALFVAYGMSSQAFAEIFGSPEGVGDASVMTYSPPSWLLLGLYALGAVIAYAGALAAISAWLSWRLDPARGRTLRYLALGLPFGTAAAVFSRLRSPLLRISRHSAPSCSPMARSPCWCSPSASPCSGSPRCGKSGSS